MSSRIRGQEALLTVTVDGERQEGSFFKVRDFRVTPRTDIIEEDYLGELKSDLDIQHHGFDGSFTVDNEDALTISYLSEIIAREENHERHPSIVISVEYVYREPGNLGQIEAYSDCFLKVSEQSIGGRKEYVQTSFEWKAKERQQITSPG